MPRGASRLQTCCETEDNRPARRDLLGPTTPSLDKATNQFQAASGANLHELARLAYIFFSPLRHSLMNDFRSSPLSDLAEASVLHFFIFSC